VIYRSNITLFIISLKSKKFLDNGISSGVYFHFNLWRDKDILS